MPTYQYACTECGEQLEAVQKFTDEPLTECPACHGRLRKVFNSVGIVFKGSGFYRTDSRNGSTASSPASTSSDSSSADTSTPSESSGSSASKPDSKSPAASTSTSSTSAGASVGSGSSASKAATS